MGVSQYAILASPDISGLAGLLILTGIFVPIFVFLAIHGAYVGIAILQALALGCGEAIYWKLTRRRTLSLRVIGSIGVYLFLNICFLFAFLLMLRPR